MPIYTAHGPFTNGAAPGIDASFLNAVESQLVAVSYGLNFITPFLLVNNIAIPAGTTNTYTARGGSTGVPTGAIGIMIQMAFASTTTGSWVGVAPSGGAINQYFAAGNVTVASSAVNGWGIVPLSGAGQIDVKGNTGTCNVTLYINGYVL